MYQQSAVYNKYYSPQGYIWNISKAGNGHDLGEGETVCKHILKVNTLAYMSKRCTLV